MRSGGAKAGGGVMVHQNRSVSDIAAHPHDGIVRYAFSKRVHAKGLLQAILPRSLARAIAWSTLKLDKDSFVNPELRRRYADLLFSMRIRGTEVRVYVLFEHQRRVDPLMMLRLFVYMGRIWERLARDDPKLTKIPAIMPVLLHNGKSGWSAATSFEALVDLPEALRPELLPRTPKFAADLVDLSPAHATAIADEWLTAFGKLVLWALSVAGDDARFMAEIGRMKAALRESLAAEDGFDALGALLRYISATHQRFSSREFKQAIVAATAEEDEEKMTTVLEKIWQEVANSIKARAEMLLELLAAKLGPVPAKTRAQVMAADEATLRRWSLRVLTETTLAGVLDAPKPKRARKAAPAARHARAGRA